MQTLEICARRMEGRKEGRKEGREERRKGAAIDTVWIPYRFVVPACGSLATEAVRLK